MHTIRVYYDMSDSGFGLHNTDVKWPHDTPCVLVPFKTKELATVYYKKALLTYHKLFNFQSEKPDHQCNDREEYFTTR